MKVNAQAPTWTKTFGTDLNDAGYSIAKTYDGGYIVGGTTTFDTGNKDILLLKLDSEGDTLWTKTFGGTFNDESFCVKQCRDSGFVIAGYKSTGSSNMDFYIIKTDASGNQQWNRTYGGALNEGSYSIIQTCDLGFAVCGYTGSIGAGAKDMMLLKYDEGGNLFWQKTYGGVEDELAYALTQTEDSGFVLVGTTKSYGENNLGDVYAIRTNSTGDTIWTRDYVYQGTDVAYDVAAVNGGYFIITGKTNSSGDSSTATYNAFALKINSEGNPIFFTTYGSQFDECAYAIKEMPDLSYILAGTTNNPERGGTGNDIYMVKIGEWGDTLDTHIYGTQYNDEARSFCIDDNENIVLVGKSFNPTSLNDISLIAYPFCKRYFPRYIWLNNVYNQAPATQPDNIIVYDNINNIWIVDNQKLDDLANYLTTLKYSGVVITHLEDVFKNADSTQLKNCMAQVVGALHTRGIPVILNQFRTDEESMLAIESKDLMIEHLSSSIIYNQNALSLSRFDGLLLDYEFWGEDYALDANFAQINDGFRYFDAIANEFTVAKANPNNHFKTLAMWIGNTVFACDTCDFNGDGLFGNNTIYARADDETLMNMFDSHHFNRLVLSFFLDDDLDPIKPYTKFDDPLTFLQRKASGININQFFARLYYLGENTDPTNVVPHFHAGSGNGSSSLPKLELYLNGTGPWWSLPANGNGAPHYLHEVEEEFISQYVNPNIFDDQNPNGIFPPNIIIKNWGTTTIMQGFEWFRYQLGPLDFASLSTRANDKIKAWHWTCGSTLRTGVSNQPLPTTALTTHNAVDLSLTPQPVQSTATLYIKNFIADDFNAITLQCYDAMGKLLTDEFVITRTEATEFGTLLNVVKTNPTTTGLLLIKVHANGTLLGTTKALTIK